VASRLPARSFGRLRSLSIRRRWAATYAIAEFGFQQTARQLLVLWMETLAKVIGEEAVNEQDPR
jgi:hypothetical protein